VIKLTKINSIFRVKDGSELQLVIRSIKKSRISILGIIIVAILILMGLFGPLLVSNTPYEMDIDDRLATPSLEAPFGKDEFGRDIFTRVLYGLRISLTVGIVVVSISGTIGVFLGLVAGYYGGISDSLIMRLTDIILAFPGLVLALAVAAAIGPNIINVMLILSFTWWTSYARIVRGEVLSIREEDYVTAAKVMGVKDWTVTFRHVLPNVIGPIVVFATLQMSYAILAEASLSFLGVGLRPPEPSLGVIINGGKEFLRVAPHVSALSGFVIMLLVLGFNLLGDGLRDSLDPKMRRI